MLPSPEVPPEVPPPEVYVKQSHKTLLLWLLLIVMMIAIYQLVEPSNNPQEVAFSQFVTDVRQGHVESVVVSPGAASSAIFE